MPASLIDGNAIAAQIYAEINKEKASAKPGLAFILVGDHPPSQAYVGMKEKRCREMGYHSHILRLSSTVHEDTLLSHINELNEDPQIHGILVQQPLPSSLNSAKVVNAIDPRKDVDGFHPLNLGKLVTGEEDGFLPCTPYGILQLLSRSGIDPAGKHVVIVGRSTIVGKPLALLLCSKRKGCNATVTLCHSRTEDLPRLCASADILVAAIGSPGFIKGEWVKKGSVVIDVGINRTSDGKIVGDVDFQAARERASLITPVPGGVGPMTIAMLLYNTWQSYLLWSKIGSNARKSL